MKHYITKTHADRIGQWSLCADGAVIQEFGDTTQDRSAAVRALAQADDRWSIIAAAAPADDPMFVPWTSKAIGFVGVETSDRRVIDDGAVTFRTFPLPLLAQTVTAWGHDGAFIVGRIDESSVNGKNIPATGIIDLALDDAWEVARMVKTQVMNRVSIDPGGGAMETEITEYDDEGWAVDWLDHYTAIEIAGATVCTVSAFAEAKLDITADLPADPAGDGEQGAIAAAANLAVDPPLPFFEQPILAGRTRLTISEPDKHGHRRVFGHLAPWGECHIGLLDKCVMAPHSASNYGWFQLGTMKCAEGCEIPIGTITMDSGHADKSLTARAAAAHYDQTGWAIADITVGEDEHGIWFSGSTRPGVTDEQLRALRAARLSGDWRSVNGQLDLVAVAAVNVGGFPVYEESLYADGSVRTLIASLGSPETPITQPGRVVDQTLRQALAPLLEEAADRLDKRVHATT